MDFHVFAQLLFPFCGDGKKKSDFVIALIDNIMEEPSNETDKVKAVKGEYNPLAALQADALNRIYNGTRRITAQNFCYIRTP